MFTSRWRVAFPVVFTMIIGALAFAQAPPAQPSESESIPMAKPGPPASVNVEPAPLKKPDEPITLQGRGDKIEVREKNGKVREVDKKSLVVLNRSKAEVRKPDVKRNAEPKAQTEAGAPATDPEKEKAAKEKAEKEKADKEKAAAVRQSDAARLRSVQGEGGWFYDENNKPISSEELDKRIESGKVAGIKSVDIHLQDWKTESKPEKEGEEK